MKKINLIFTAICAILFLSQTSKAQEDDFFAPSQLESIHEEIMLLINDYNSKLKLIGDVDEDADEKEAYYIPAFVELFYGGDAGKSTLINDLDPTGKTSKSFVPEDYATNMILFFPTFGVESKLLFESMKFGAIQFYSVGQYALDITIDKELSGLYMDKNPNRKTVSQTIKIVFDRRAAVIDKFKIAGIRDVEAVKDQLFIDKSWWDVQSPQWQKVLRNAISFTGDPEHKELLAIRQFITYDDNTLKLSEGAFNLSHMIAEVEPVKQKKKMLAYTGIVFDDNAEGLIKLQNENGNIQTLSKEQYRVKQRKTPEEIEKLTEQLAKLELDSIKYTLILDNGFIFPVTISEKNSDNTKLKAKIPNLGNKKISYSIFEIQEIILPVKRQGFYVTAHASSGYSMINDANIDVNDESTWQAPKAKFGTITAGASIEYYFTENLGVGIGIGYGNFETKYSLVPKNDVIKDNETIGVTEIAPNNNTEVVEYPAIYNVSEGAYLNRKFNAIEIPIYLTYISSAEAYRSGFYARIGVKYSLATSQNSGEGTINRNIALDDDKMFTLIGNNSYEVSNQKITDVVENYGYKSSLYGILSVGWIKPIGKGRNFVTIGPSIEYCPNISNGEFNDIFNKITNEKVSPLKIGFDFGISFKLTKE